MSLSAEPLTSVDTFSGAAVARTPMSALSLADAAPLAVLTEIAPRRKRGRPRNPEADGRILDAASELILARGYDAMTVDDVAAHARVGKATVYRRWAKKEDLAVAAMRRLYATRMPVPDTGSLRGDLLASVRATLEFAGSEAGAAYLRTAVAESVRDSRIAALYRQANEETELGLRQMCERAILRGEMRADAHLEGASQVIAGIVMIRTVTGAPMPDPSEAEALVDLLLSGLAA